jgi:hypothetical protein
MGASAKARLLAEWLRIGMNTEDVEYDEDVEVMEVYGLIILADIIGLMLIGKMGKTKALKFFQKICAKYNDFEGKEKIYEEIGLNAFDGCCLHHEGTKRNNADQIIEALENGGIEISLVH